MRLDVSFNFEAISITKCCDSHFLFASVEPSIMWKNLSYPEDSLPDNDFGLLPITCQCQPRDLAFSKVHELPQHIDLEPGLPLNITLKVQVWFCFVMCIFFTLTYLWCCVTSLCLRSEKRLFNAVCFYIKRRCVII